MSSSSFVSPPAAQSIIRTDNFSAAVPAAPAVGNSLAFSLPPLYKIGAHDQILVWSICFDGTKLITAWGTEEAAKKGTLQIVSSEVETNNSGRNLREQAELEARSKWKRKCDKDGYSDKPMDMSILTMPAMLANVFNPKGKQVRFPAFVSTKCDGLRMRANYDENNEIFLISRTKLVINHFNHIREDLKKLFPYITKYLLHYFPNQHPLFRTDGELYTTELPFDEMNGISRLTEKSGASVKEKLLNYYIFDLVIAGKYTYDERLQILVAAYNEYIKENPNSQVFLMLTEIVNSNAEVLVKHNEYVAQGYEGVIVRMFGGKNEKEREQSYYYGRRCNAILKYKEFEDAEGAVIGANPGTGTESGAIIWQIRAANGKVFDCRPRGSIASRRELYNNFLASGGKDFIGRAYRYRFQELTTDGVPRFAVGLGFAEDRAVPGAHATNSNIELQQNNTVIEIGKIIGASGGQDREAGMIFWNVQTPDNNVICIRPSESEEKRKEFFAEWMKTGGASFIGKKYSYQYGGKGPNGEYKNLLGGKILQTEVGKIAGAFGTNDILSWNIMRKDGTTIIVHERNPEIGKYYFNEWMKNQGKEFIGKDYEYEVVVNMTYGVSVGFI